MPHVPNHPHLHTWTLACLTPLTWHNAPCTKSSLSSHMTRLQPPALRPQATHPHSSACFLHAQVKEYGRKRARAQSAAADRNWAEAESLFAAALHVDQSHRVGNTELWRGLGDARFNLGLFMPAKEAYEAVMTLTGRADEAAKAAVVRCLLGAEQWQDAVNAAREFVGEHQQSRELRMLQAEADKRLKMSLRKVKRWGPPVLCKRWGPVCARWKAGGLPVLGEKVGACLCQVKGGGLAVLGERVGPACAGRKGVGLPAPCGRCRVSAPAAASRVARWRGEVMWGRRGHAWSLYMYM
eukprot:364187-Chlamydomonas_euryale.AAC.1